MWDIFLNRLPLTLADNLEAALCELQMLLGNIGEITQTSRVYLCQTALQHESQVYFTIGWHQEVSMQPIQNTPPAVINFAQEKLRYPKTIYHGVSTENDMLLEHLHCQTARLYPIFEAAPSHQLWGFLALDSDTYQDQDDLHLSIAGRQLAILLNQAIASDMRRRMRLGINLIYKIASVFMTEDDWQTQAQQSLKILCEELKMSRAYYYLQCEDNSNQFCVNMEVCHHEGLPSVKGGSLEVLECSWFDSPQTEPKVQIGNVDMIASPLKERLIENDVQFYVSVPIQYNDKLVGILVLDDVEKPHQMWSRNSEAVLHSIADIMTNGYVRAQIEAKRRENAKLLEIRNAALQTFSGLVAHDIKAPLRHIKTEISHLKPETLNSSVKMITTQIQTLEDMIRRLEYLAKSYRPYRSKVGESVTSVLDARNRLKPILAQRNIQLLMPTELPYFVGREEWLTEVFYNLILNASQSFPPHHPNPTIIVSQAPTSDTSIVHLVVWDNSVGIPQDRVQELREMFSSENPMYDRQGLGLTLVHFLIIRMGGMLDVISKEGQGTTFWFSLPAPTPEQRANFIG
ncbi:MAG: hypothetical protein CUN55_09430 [Phototrophicales bacterium]|nr:MAG: hypothetical protein CUN55_09430 [Phototrophicales bacterium]